MRHQHLWPAIRIVVAAGLAMGGACNEPAPTGASPGLFSDLGDQADQAGGIDAHFGVEAFHLTDPILKITAPADKTIKMVATGGKTTFGLAFSTQYFTPGKINCYVDGKLDGATVNDAFTTSALPLGLHTIGCVLVDNAGSEYTAASARAVLRVIVSMACTTNAACDDGLACTQQGCFNDICTYDIVTGCCGSSFECAAGETCTSPNTSTSKCSACAKDADCDDKYSCTVDTCDLSGPKGVCKHVKTDKECCVADDKECDDGKACTVDSCNKATGKCLHVQPPGTCCADSECSSDDACLFGACVDYQCRFAKDAFRPDCCSAGTNPTCNDNYLCTIDKCDQPQADGWTKCSHKPDDSKPNCCDPNFNTNECQDGNSCTYDVCAKDAQCYNIPIADCCAKDEDCDDGNLCTQNKCDIPAGQATGSCKATKIPECCTVKLDCDDGKFCTIDACNTSANTCVYTKQSGCCDTAEECDDGKYCTQDVCVNYVCAHGPDKFKPNCCDGNLDCNDADACTLDSCNTATKQCVFAPNGDASCCNSAADCDDGDCTTANFCDASNKCTFKKASGACKETSECDDGNSCTIDSCDTIDGCGQCTHAPNPACCKYDTECNDDKPCTLDRCLNQKCEHTAISSCCADDKDALTACDDNNACTIEYCLNYQCRHTAPKNGCCADNADCDDGVTCTTDTCDNIQSGQGTCKNVAASGCSVCTADNAATTCNDNNACTIDACLNNTCIHTPKVGCCNDKFDCDDGVACTLDDCIDSMHYCVHFEEIGGLKPCCTPETEATECHSLTSACTIGKCLDQPDGSRQCVATPKAACTYDLNYCQDFSASTSLALLGWNPVDLASTAKGNWSVATNGGLGPDQYARLNWTPTKLNYDTCLTSPVFQAAGSSAVSIQFDREFVQYTGLTNLRILGSLDGENADWTKATLIDQVSQSSTLGPQTLDLTLPNELAGSNGLRLAVCVSGSSTGNFTRFGIDNFCVAKGKPPAIVNCPPNQTVLAGKPSTLPIKAKDPDLSDLVTFSLVNTPSFVTISSALYYWTDSSWNAMLTMAPKLADVGEHTVTIRVTDGHLYKLCTFQVTVTFEGGVLVWKPSEVPASLGQPLVAAIEASGRQVQMVDDLNLYNDLTKFDAIFVLLGVYPNNHELKETEVGGLKLFLSKGGKLYLEGGDTWAFDPPTSLHPFFKVQGVLDSAPSGVTGPLEGFSIYSDSNFAPPKGYKWAYQQGEDYNNLNDQIAAKPEPKTANLLRNSGFEKFWVHVAHDNDGAKYRTVASSVLFAGVKSDVDTPAKLLEQVFKFFTSGLPACANNDQCNDGNACTTDTCTDGLCSFSNTCLCNAQSSLKCGDALTKLVTNGGAATDVVQGYGCHAGVTYAGKEVAYSFKNAESAPVTIKVTNSNSAKIRLFVLKATAKGCDPDGCVAHAGIASGTGSVSFPAQANEQYYIVVDAEGDSDAATFDLEVICTAGEICDDGKDNNGNGVIDCEDWASCCGFPACGEVCDGVDNDCNGTVDDGCDDDGDQYCDGTKSVKKSAKCVKSALPADSSVGSGDDCADGDVSTNPGAQEICGNGKDDNCDGNQDEAGAAGCTPFYADLDGDGFGAGSAKCLCQAEGAYKATAAGDCDDANKDVNPAAAELCSTPGDDNCNGDANDLNATGCKNFYLDKDSDGFGANGAGFKCLCVAAGDNKADKAGDCDDANQALNPGKAEICNNLDDNCNGSVDEGCDDDKDGYCDLDLNYDQTAEPMTVCPKGPGDSDDADKAINPEGKEICDNKDNNSNGLIDEGCDDDKDTYCDGSMITIGTPTVCAKGGGDCDDTSNAKNPGVVEDCATAYDDNCNGSANDIGAKGCSPFFYDADGDNFGTSSNQCLCVSAGLYKAPNPGDCLDSEANIHPDATEICDGMDNDCDKVVDDGCDDDLDGFCDKAMTIVGNPALCPSGGGDCNDQVATINPSRAEVCGNDIDENCDGSLNAENATNCVNFYTDADGDDFGAGAAKCYCVATGSYKTSQANDCKDDDKAINPAAAEDCDGKDNDCNGQTDEGCDEDGDGYCAAGKVVATGALCTNGGDDCNDKDPNIYKGKTGEICDGKDDDCNGKVDNGCDDDKDGYCDASLILSDPPPAACSKGGGDCDDFNFDQNPGAPEVCNNSIDDNCNGSQNDENAGGCSKFYFDADGDAVGLAISKCLCTGVGKFTAPATGDCNDADKLIKPGALEICDAADNDCNGTADDAGADGCSTFYNDADKDGFGIDVTQCLCAATGTFSATKKGDCNDTVKAISPGATEACNDIDDNCNGEVDEGCNADGDEYCVASKTVVGFPTVCPKGGGDCNDNDPAVSTAGAEKCNGSDDNCNGSTDEGCDTDSDGYCDANMTTVGSPAVCNKGGGDCDDNQSPINPGVKETCGNTVDENCNGSYNDENATGCTTYYEDADGDGFGKNGGVAKCLCIKTGNLTATKAGDCDDSNDLVNGGASELCDGIDNNCNSLIDEGCDVDGDGYCDATKITIGKPPVCPGGGGDCDDQLKTINPGATEVCGNTIDENCDGSLNAASATNCTDYFYDGDKDGFGVNVKQCLCTPENGFTASKGGDCDDTTAAINPDATEVCGDGKDNNCNGNNNEPGAQGCSNYYKDGDKDGYGSGLATCLCTAEGEFLTKVGGDCKDDDATIRPGATEICDAKDNNCNVAADEGCDDDNDGHCDAAMQITAAATCVKSTPKCDGTLLNGVCYQAFPVLKGWTSAQYACQLLGGNVAHISTPEENSTVRAAITKGCGSSASGWIGLNDVLVEGAWAWASGAGVTYTNWASGQPNNTATLDAVKMLADASWQTEDPATGLCYVCRLGKVSVGSGDDCNDADAGVSPSAVEVCDDKDNNCDKIKDDGCDNDLDGYCSKAKTIVGSPAVCTKGSGDCDDSNNAVHPGKSELCDDADNDCNGQTDTGCDDDGDGYCDNAMGTVGTPAICVKGGNDCKDTDKNVNPGATEICGDGLDNNCVGGADEICNDEDGDGYCKGNQAPSAGCPKGGGDCNDANKAQHPGAKEDCKTVNDDNCDGVTNEANAVNCVDFYLDSDKDGFGAKDSGPIDDLSACTGCGNGSNGDFNATSNQSLVGGTYNYKTFTIGAGVTVTVTGSAPLILRVQGKATIHGTLVLNGKDGYTPPTYSGGSYPGGEPGPGGGKGGDSYYGYGGAQVGQGSGGGGPGCDSGYGAGGGGGGYGGSGSTGGTSGNSCGPGGSGGSPNGTQQLITLTGGSGGGAGGYGSAANSAGGAGGGGGGAVRIDALEVIVSSSGKILANGGNGGGNTSNGDGGGGGGGSGGAVWLRADKVTLQGSVQAKGGAGGLVPKDGNNGGDGGAGGDGRVRLDANTFTGESQPVSYKGGAKVQVVKICQCAQTEGASATVSGDCDDDNGKINPGAAEVCDALDNDCDGDADNGCDADGDGFCAAGKQILDTKACPKTGTIKGPSCTDSQPSLAAQVNMQTYSHGGGFHHFRKEFWYPNWSGPTIYRFNQSYQYLGNFDGGQYEVMDLEGDKGEDAWYSANWGYATISRRNGTNSGATWNTSIGSTAGGVAVTASYVYGVRYSGNPIYVLNKTNGAVVTTFNATANAPNGIHGGVFVHGDFLWLPNGSGRTYYKFDLAGTYQNQTFQTVPYIYNGAYDGSRICVSANDANVYCYDLGKTTCTVGDDCKDDNAAISPEAVESCDDLDNNCNAAVDEGCDGDKDGYCSANAALPFGNCCTAHVAAGCSVSTIQQCLCGKPGYEFCCQTGWTAQCAAAAKSQGCSTCKFPAVCPAGGADCDDQSNTVNPAGKESCGTPEDDDCDGTANTINADGCVKYYLDNDQDGFGSATYKCICTGEDKYTASVSGDCDDNNANVFAGFAIEHCDGVDNNCNGTTDELCDADADGYCDAGKKVIKNTACPKSQSSDPTCGDTLLSTAQFLPRTIGVAPRSYGGGYHSKRKEFWFPEYNSSNTVMYRYDEAAPYKELGSFQTGLPYIRQVAGDPATDDWYAATYEGISNPLYRMQGLTSTKVWQSAGLTSYFSGVAENQGIVYAMRYAGDNRVYAVNASNGQRRSDKEFVLSTTTGTAFGIGFIDGKFWRASDDTWIYRYDPANGGFDGTRLRASTNIYAAAVTATEFCTSNGSSLPVCITMPKANESYGSMQTWANPRSHGSGYHFFRKEYWYPNWSGSTIYRYNNKLHYVGDYNSGQDQLMQVWGDSAEDAWYSANWGHNTITRRNGLGTSAAWSFNIGSTAGGVTVAGNSVYAMRASEQTVWELNKANGSQIRTFSLNGWFAGSTNHGGLVAENGKLWRADSGRWFARYNISNGAWDGMRIYLDTYPYSTTWDGNQFCYSPNNSYQYCLTLPNNTTMHDRNSTGNGGSGGANTTRTFSMDVDSYGLAWNPKDKEFWSPEWSSGNVKRYNSNGGYLGNFGIAYGENMDMWVDTDGSFATANWGQNVCRRYNASKGHMWSYNIGTTTGGVAGDEDSIYCMRYNNNTVWVQDKNTGSHRYSFGMEGATSYLYGGLEIDGDTLIMATDNAYVRTFDKRTGRHRGVSFRTAVGAYTSAWTGTELCVGSNNGNTQTMYCYDIRDTQNKPLQMRQDIRNYARSHGAGYHPYYKEFYYPEWAGDTIYRYNQSKSYVGSFRNGRGNIMHLDGDRTTSRWYAAEWGNNTIGAFDGWSYGPVWTRNIGTTAGAVATDGTHVWGVPHSGGQVYKLDKSNGNVLATFSLSGGPYAGYGTYGPVAIIGSTLWRTDTSGNVQSHDAATGAYTGSLLQFDWGASHTGTFDPVDRELCAHHNSYSGESRCLILPTTAGAGATRPLGMDAKSHGGGFHQNYNQYWYPEWNSNDATVVYRYDADGKQLGTFNSGLRYVSQIWGDKNGNDWFASVYDGSSTYARVHRMAPMSNTKVWTAPYVTTYLGGVTADKDFVYTMRVNSDTRVYAFDRATGNRRSDKEFNLNNWNGNTTWGLSTDGTKLWRGTEDAWIWRYDMSNGDHDGVKIPTAVAVHSMANNGKELCVANNSTPSLVYCYEIENASQSYKATQRNVATYGEGGGFHHFRNEFWYPQWSSGDSAMYRYSKQRTLIGVFAAKQRYIRQVWGDTSADVWYSANWNDSSITRRRGLTSDLDWTYNIGSNPGGVAGDDTALYAMPYSSTTVHQINKKTGQLIKTFNLSGGTTGYLYGGLAVAQGKLFRGSHDSWVWRYSLATGAHDNVRFTMPVGIYAAAFDGTEYCVSDSNGGNTATYCVPIVGSSCKPGDDCEDNAPAINPGAAEFCDSSDNNCNAKVDEDCDKDGDGYCDGAKIVIGAPSVCTSGGGDCNDSSAVENPGSAEVCDNKDNNCNKIIDEIGASGCSTFYLDGDQDGWGVTTGSKCLCKADGVYSATKTGDCNDTSADVAPGKPEICDGKNNDCATSAATGSLYSRQFTLSTDVARHGSGYHPKRDEYWYSYWSNPTIYRYNTNGGYVGNFPTGQNEMMGIAGDTVSDDYFTANWGYATVTRRTMANTSTLWSRSLGSAYPSGIHYDGTYVYVMKDYNDIATVYVLNPSNGADVPAKPHFNLSGDGFFSSNGDHLIYGGMFVKGDRLYRTSRNGWTYRYFLTNGQHDGVKMWTPAPSSYVDNSVSNGNELCVTQHGNNVIRCYTLPSANTDLRPTVRSMETYSHGGGYHHYRQEYWYPQWSGQTIYRYNAQRQYLGAFNSGQNEQMDVEGDMLEDAWYGANWGYYNITRRNGFNTGAVWTTSLGYYAGGVAVDKDYVYAMRADSTTVWVLNRSNGGTNRTFNVATGSNEWDGNWMHGGLAVHNNVLYRASGGGRWIHGYNVSNGAFSGIRIYTADSIWNSSYDGKEICISPNNSTNYCYNLGGGSVLVDTDCDKDGDGYCDANKTTVGKPASCPNGAGDCNDSASSVNPKATEQCNGADDNCNSVVDDGANTFCEANKNAEAKCENGACKIYKCNTGFSDMNGLGSDGCECNSMDPFEPNDTCAQAITLEQVKDAADLRTIKARVTEMTDSDWYKFYAYDNPDSGTSVCDQFNVRVRFLQNPDNALRFEVFRGVCPPGKYQYEDHKSNVVDNAVCCGQTDFNWFTNYKGYTKNYYSSGYSEFGECNCTTNNSTFYTGVQGWNYGPSNNPYGTGAGGPYGRYNASSGVTDRNTASQSWGYDFTRCRSNSATFFVRVYRAGAMTNCADYQLEVTNAVYGAPSSGHNGYGVY